MEKPYDGTGFLLSHFSLHFPEISGVISRPSRHQHISDSCKNGQSPHLTFQPLSFTKPRRMDSLMKVFLPLIVLLTFLTPFTYGQSRQPNRKAKPLTTGTKDATLKVLVPIDIEATYLPKGYKGNDPQQVFETLAERQTPKGEFET